MIDKESGTLFQIVLASQIDENAAGSGINLEDAGQRPAAGHDLCGFPGAFFQHLPDLLTVWGIPKFPALYPGSAVISLPFCCTAVVTSGNQFSGQSVKQIKADTELPDIISEGTVQPAVVRPGTGEIPDNAGQNIFGVKIPCQLPEGGVQSFAVRSVPERINSEVFVIEGAADYSAESGNSSGNHLGDFGIDALETVRAFLKLFGIVGKEHRHNGFLPGSAQTLILYRIHEYSYFYFEEAAVLFFGKQDILSDIAGCRDIEAVIGDYPVPDILAGGDKRSRFQHYLPHGIVDSFLSGSRSVSVADLGRAFRLEPLGECCSGPCKKKEEQNNDIFQHSDGFLKIDSRHNDCIIHTRGDVPKKYHSRYRTEVTFMIKAFLYSVAVFMLTVLTGCSSPPPAPVQNPPAAEEQALRQRSHEGLKPYADRLVEEVVRSVPDSGEKPRVAIATPVDVASLEHTDWLGRELAEYFVAGLHRQGYRVLEYKLTGWLEITPNGDYIYSRNWQKLAGKANITHILSGTMSRNDDGVMIYGRLVNMKNSVVEGASDIFIPYQELPECYRKYPRTCGDHPVYDPAMTRSGGNANKRSGAGAPASGKATAARKPSGATPASGKTARASGKPAVRKDSGKPASAASESVPPRVNGAEATSRGNADIPCAYCNGMSSCRAKCVNPEIYPASSMIYNDTIIRDVRNQSQYDRR